MVSLHETNKKCMEMPRINNYTKGHLLHFFSYYESYYQLIGTDLSRQVNTSISEQNNLTEKLEKSSLHIGSIRTFCPKKSGKKIDKIHKGF